VTESNNPQPVDRRLFLGAAMTTGAGLVVAGCATQRRADDPAAGDAARRDEPPEREEHEGEEEGVSPAEDLMREHGVLKRIILVYREGVRRIGAGEDLPPGAIFDSAVMIRTFIEDYHEKLEEDFLFPRFRAADEHVELVRVLTEQHAAGRRLTDTALALADLPALRDPGDRRRLSDALAAFIRMYEPHEAREDTVLFPALRRIVTPHEYAALGEDFEDKEHDLFGADGFEAMVDRVARIEKSLGIYDLAGFTPAG
jgi:hemerythrin-like domain-containing protein